MRAGVKGKRNLKFFPLARGCGKGVPERLRDGGKCIYLAPVSARLEAGQALAKATMGKEKIEMDHGFRSTSVSVLWNYISTAGGLELWFADEVRQSGPRRFAFVWGGAEQQAALVASRVGHYMRFRWDDDPDRVCWELRIEVSDLTGETELHVTDWASPDEADELRELWNGSVGALSRMLGCG